MDTELTDAEKSQLKAYLNTESGKKLLMKLVSFETTLLARAYSDKSSLELQGQLVNRVSGIHSVRTLLGELIEVKK